jgi:hypothetical protein
VIEVPHGRIVKDGKHLEVIGPVVVDGKSCQDHVITRDEEINSVEKRCPLKG